ncbi:TPA: hypothetical protein ACT9BX_002261 [Legionella pneumophila]|nr:hypothetical protein [Legionella pneumophila]HAT8742783.1 hypothetical protein [Legionella pneumophila]
MDNFKSLKELLETLQRLKVALRDTAEPSISRQLDEAIAELQSVIGSDEAGSFSSAKALGLLGKVLSSLPSIAKLIDIFFG